MTLRNWNFWKKGKFLTFEALLGDLPCIIVLESCWSQTLVQIEGPLEILDLNYNNCGNPVAKKLYILDEKMHTEHSNKINRKTISIST